MNHAKLGHWVTVIKVSVLFKVWPLLPFEAEQVRDQPLDQLCFNLPSTGRGGKFSRCDSAVGGDGWGHG